MIITILALLVGTAILAGGLYYLAKEKNDPESRKIYGVIAAVGAAVLAGTAIKILILGF